LTAIRLVSFDLDGTLFPDTTTCLELGKSLGHLARIKELESRYQRYEISNADVAEGDAVAYTGKSVREIEDLVLQIPMIGNFRETLETLRQLGMISLIVTVSWSFAARTIAKHYGVHGFAGAEMTEKDGILGGTIARHFEAEDKVRFVESVAEMHGFGLDQCAAIGDSRSDIPLFGRVARSIALNATKEAKEAASISIETRDLRDILPLLVR
jgi:phosphoserine phosphatase